MKKSASLLVLVLLLLTALPVSLAAVPYDSPTVKNFMRRNVADLSKVQEAINAKDFKAAADAFADFQNTAKSLVLMDPPKGDPGMWKSIWTEFAEVAEKGLNASQAGDQAKALEAVASLKAFMGQGHKTYRF